MTKIFLQEIIRKSIDTDFIWKKNYMIIIFREKPSIAIYLILEFEFKRKTISTCISENIKIYKYNILNRIYFSLLTFIVAFEFLLV